MTVLNEILSFLINFNIHIYLFSLAFLSRFKLKKGRFWILLLGSAAILLIPHLYRQITDLSFYSSFFFMIGWYSVSYLVLCAFLFLIFYVSFQVSAKELLLILCCSYLLQNIIYEIHLILITGFPKFDRSIEKVINVAMVIVGSVVVCLISKKKVIKFDLSRIKTFTVFLFSVCLIVMLTGIIPWIKTFKSDVIVMEMGCYLYAGITSILLLCILVGIFNTSRLRYENAVINELLRNSEKQYRISSENIEYINSKVHDLKHQISAIKQLIGRGIEPVEMQNKIAELEKMAKMYDDTILTGNMILDNLIAEQKLFCDKNQIGLDYIVDGSALNFMDPVDLYAMFGNALDNAVESVLKIEDVEKRVITLAVKKNGGLVNVCIENQYLGQISFSDGVPHTSKPDKMFHGFGIKSIQYIVHKYGGNMTISAEQNRFCLSILIPEKATSINSKERADIV